MAIRFQFRLRTLMIVVTLLAVPLGYVGWQAKIVRERKVTGEKFILHNGLIMWSTVMENTFPEGLEIRGERKVDLPYPKSSWLRRLLGDDYALFVWYPSGMSADEVNCMKAAFPEAVFRLIPSRKASGL